jgi:hypothetical protein
MLRKGEKSLSDIPLKQPDPWATLYPYAPAQLPAQQVKDEKGKKLFKTGPVPIYGDNLTELSTELQTQYPAAKTQKQKWKTLAEAYGQPGRYQLLTKAKAPITMNGKPYIDGAPDRPWQLADTAFVPTKERMSMDPQAASNYAPERRFGVLAHEMRHIIDERNSPYFHADPRGSQRQQLQDSYGNQLGHFAGDFSDRDMVNAFRVLRMAQETGRVPRSTKITNPWIRGSNPKAEDLMGFIGEQPGLGVNISGSPR